MVRWVAKAQGAGWGCWGCAVLGAEKRRRELGVVGCGSEGVLGK